MKKLFIFLIIISCMFVLVSCSSADDTNSQEAQTSSNLQDETTVKSVLETNPYIGVWTSDEESDLPFKTLDIFDSINDDIEGDENLIALSDDLVMLGVGEFNYDGTNGTQKTNLIHLDFNEMGDFYAYFSEDKSIMYVVFGNTLLEKGAQAQFTMFYKEGSAPVDVNADEKDTLSALIEAIGDEAEGKTIMQTGQEEINGVLYDTYVLGTDTAEKFTGEKHFATNANGDVLVLDIILNEWLEYTK